MSDNTGNRALIQINRYTKDGSKIVLLLTSLNHPPVATLASYSDFSKTVSFGTVIYHSDQYDLAINHSKGQLWLNSASHMRKSYFSEYGPHRENGFS